ncbi:MAG TPA: carboxypeptidase-like regulatory domain-containing protein, partial [Terriglobia bacterium]|nr:carboxypeptidase-like regulatory domain-containing protein [Terriglobia bacterium]
MHTRRRVYRCVLLPLLAVLLFVSAADAQTDRGTITGAVTDPSGAVLVGAKITVVNTATGSSVETSTSGAGLFTVPQLTVGVYRVTIEQAGFKKHVQEGVTVPLGQTVRVEAVLQVGEVSQSVEVQ